MKKFFLKMRAKFTSAPIAIIFLDGVASRAKGQVSQKLLNEFTRVANEKNVETGLITVVSEGGVTALRFKGGFDASAKQRFRNIWFSQSERKMMRV